MVPNRVTLYRARMKAAGYKLVQYWVIDTRSPDLVEKLNRQCRSLHEDEGEAEAEAISFEEAAVSLIEDWE